MHPFGLSSVLSADPRPSFFRTPPHASIPFFVLARVAQVVTLSAFQRSVPDRQFGAITLELGPVEDSYSVPTARAEKPRTGTTVMALGPVDRDNIFRQPPEASEHGNSMLETHPILFGD